jgi:transcriptional regulator with XRE-family HTH domain
MPDYRINLRLLVKEEEQVKGYHLTVSELSNRTGLSRTALLNLRKDGTSWSRVTLNALCEFFNKSADEILYDHIE